VLQLRTRDVYDFGVLRCVAVCCSVLQSVVENSRVFQLLTRDLYNFSVLMGVAACCRVSRSVAE